MLNTSPHKNLVAETISAILVSKNITEAAELLEVDRTTLYKRFESHPEIKEIASAVQEYSQVALKLASAKAVNVLVKCLNNMDVETRIQAAKEILDRGGLVKSSPNIISSIQVNDLKPEPLVITLAGNENETHTQ